MTRTQRILAASSFSFLALSAVLLFLAYKHRADGITLLSVLRVVAAVLALTLSIQGTRLRHRSRE